MRTWEEAGTVKLHDKMSPKIHDCGATCMMVGHPKDHSGDCYCMWDKETGRIHVTCDITSLHHMYFPPKVTGHEVVCKIEDLNVTIPQTPNISAWESGVTRGENSNAETTGETTNMKTQPQGQVEGYVHLLF